jgi:hypothetical protein
MLRGFFTKTIRQYSVKASEEILPAFFLDDACLQKVRGVEVVVMHRPCADGADRDITKELLECSHEERL